MEAGKIRERIIQDICSQKLIAIIRGADEAQAVAAAEVLCAGGVTLVEVTFNQKEPESFVHTANAIRAIREKLGDRMLVGAGTVTSPELVELAAKHSAQHIVSPDTDPAVIARTRELGLVSLPGAYTPTEAKQAHNAGADFVKLFPCVGDAPAYIKALCGPLNHIRFLAVGGVTADNAKSFLQAGAVGLGVGSSLVNPTWAAAGEYFKITEEAKRFVANIQ